MIFGIMKLLSKRLLNKEITSMSESMVNEQAWDYAIGIVQTEGIKPTEEFLKLVEQEKRGEITSQEMDKILMGKYRMVQADANA